MLKLLIPLAILNRHICFNSYPRNLQLTGPTSKTRAANASPSFNGGGTVSLSRLTKRHVIRVGILARFDGIITRTPECRQPRIAPPRASTKNLDRNKHIINIITTSKAIKMRTEVN
jgi:hypothetical protein